MKREKDFYIITENVIFSSIDRKKGGRRNLQLNGFLTQRWVFNPEEFNPYNPLSKRMIKEEHYPPIDPASVKHLNTIKGTKYCRYTLDNIGDLSTNKN